MPYSAIDNSAMYTTTGYSTTNSGTTSGVWNISADYGTSTSTIASSVTTWPGDGLDSRIYSAVVPFIGQPLTQATQTAVGAAVQNVLVEWPRIQGYQYETPAAMPQNDVFGTPGMFNANNFYAVGDVVSPRRRPGHIEVIERNQHGAVPRALQNHADFTTVTRPEIKALQLLKKMLSAEDFKRYLRYGFVVVRGASGLEYQIVRGAWHLKVWNRGKKVAELCVGLKGAMPPTDSVIARMVLAQYDEPDLWRRSNLRSRNHPALKGWKNQQQRQPEDLVRLAS